MEEITYNQKMHKMNMTNRKSCSMSGIKDVLSFDIHEILLETEQGMLMIRGNDLHVNRLSLEKGEIDIDGKLDSFTYSDVAEPMGQKTQSILTRLFR